MPCAFIYLHWKGTPALCACEYVHHIGNHCFRAVYGVPKLLDFYHHLIVILQILSFGLDRAQCKELNIMVCFYLSGLVFLKSAFENSENVKADNFLDKY